MRAEHRPRVRRLRLRCSLFFVDAHLLELNGRWLATVETPQGPSQGWGRSRDAALVMALAPFDGIVDELMASAPPE